MEALECLRDENRLLRSELMQLRADRPALKMLRVHAAWGEAKFGDAEAAELAAALAANTQMQFLGLYRAGAGLGDAGGAALERALGGGRSGVACVSFDEGESRVPPARRAAIAQLCAANGLRRAAANDPALEHLALDEVDEVRALDEQVDRPVEGDGREAEERRGHDVRRARDHELVEDEGDEPKEHDEEEVGDV